jgi:hypothetical protein
MQMDVDKPKVRKALRKILSAIANVSPLSDPRWVTDANEFNKLVGQSKLLPRLSDSVLADSEIPEYAKRFRTAWTSKSEPELIPVVNGYLDEILATRNPSGDRPVFAADFTSGRWNPRPRTLLAALAMELMRSRKMLHRCESPECQRYFVKEFNRDRYCKRSCSDEMRTKGQTKWALDHRDELNAKRRKTQRRNAA